MAGSNQHKYTMVAGKAMDFATMFNHAFAGGLQGPMTFKLDLTAPAGPSTGGGKQVVQHVRLVPTDGSPAIVIGSTNPVTMAAEIRTHRHLASVHARRFKGSVLPIDPRAYGELTSQLGNFFSAQGMKVGFNDSIEASPLSVPPPAAGGGSKAWIWALVVVLILGITAAAVVVLRRGV